MDVLFFYFLYRALTSYPIISIAEKVFLHFSRTALRF